MKTRRPLSVPASSLVVGLVACSSPADRAAGPLIDGLNSQCETCHLEFWYPSQKAVLRPLRTPIDG